MLMGDEGKKLAAISIVSCGEVIKPPMVSLGEFERWATLCLSKKETQYVIDNYSSYSWYLESFFNTHPLTTTDLCNITVSSASELGRILIVNRIVSPKSESMIGDSYFVDFWFKLYTTYEVHIAVNALRCDIMLEPIDISNYLPDVSRRVTCSAYPDFICNNEGVYDECKNIVRV